MILRYLPNFITILRVVLLFPLSFLLIEQQYQHALYIFLIAGFSDGLDGFLAKKFNWVSRFGAILDPLADKALLVITMAILTYNGEISWLLFGVVAARDIFIVSGAYYYHYRLGPYEMHPSYFSKFNTFIQILLVFSILVSLGYKTLPALFLESLVYLTFFTTIGSGIHYGVLWGGKYRQEMKKRKGEESDS
ncbi:CDP-alcohol phosphatidyltransferase family protein [Aliikangiella sp. G2MR2-5]|uniref:CDP-alcohol phosphatidyltransferase family protein n=1 Tax=Aliikangiella sp. G2MR2-5 TaxID=2788943 RepID=UPI0018A94413|nr:CDP-alcohol phosphatidyltransferase family protein [Aliikangiella sp. G2MR2-5]